MELIVKPAPGTAGVRFEAETRGHRIVTDQPLDNGGSDAGMTPPELMLAALGTCAGHYALQYLRTRSLPAGDLQVRVAADKVLQPARLDGFRIDVSIPAGLDDRHREGVKRAVEKCIIHNTLTHPPRIAVMLSEVPAVPELSTMIV